MEPDTAVYVSRRWNKKWKMKITFLFFKQYLIGFAFSLGNLANLISLYP